MMTNEEWAEFVESVLQEEIINSLLRGETYDQLVNWMRDGF